MFHTGKLLKRLFHETEQSGAQIHRSMSVVERTLDVLERFAGGEGSVGVTELSEELGIPKSSVHRVLATLEGRGYVVRDPSSARYVAGTQFIHLGSTVTIATGVRTVAAPYLAELLEATGEVVHLAVYERGDCVMIDKLDSPQPVAPQSRVGVRAPSTCVSTGRALLAFQPAREIERVLERGIAQHTPQTVTDPDALRGLLDEVRRGDVAVNHSSWREGVCGVASPIRDHTGMVVASVGCCVPETRFGPAEVERLRAATRTAAAAISAELGYYSPQAKSRAFTPDRKPLAKGTA